MYFDVLAQKRRINLDIITTNRYFKINVSGNVTNKSKCINEETNSGACCYYSLSLTAIRNLNMQHYNFAFGLCRYEVWSLTLMEGNGQMAFEKQGAEEDIGN